jgi:hypothetical protein
MQPTANATVQRAAYTMHRAPCTVQFTPCNVHHAPFTVQRTADLCLAAVEALPVRVGSKAVRIERRGHVARTAWVCVLPPNSADLLCASVHARACARLYMRHKRC